jgi:glutamate synthase (NADPH/NADH) large chain
VAAALLADWPIAAVRFSRVMPRDYRRVLTVRAEAAALGVDADKMIMEASRG